MHRDRLEYVRGRRDKKVYAYNTLSTQASVGQAEYFLDLSVELVRQHLNEHPELEKLHRVVAMLRQGIGEKGVKRHLGNGNGQAAKDGQTPLQIESGLEVKRILRDQHENATYLQIPESPLPAGRKGWITPKVEKIMEWAAHGGK